MKILVSLSGGADSAVLLSTLLNKGHEVTAIGFTYGSKHNSYENECAEKLAAYYNVPYSLLDLSAITGSFKSDLLKSGGDVPEEHYEHESMRRTVVPCRNMIFISLLSGIAESIDAQAVAIGVHQGDHFIYPDCRPEFIHSMRESIEHATEGKVTLLSPLLNFTKAQVIAEGLLRHTPFELTRTCYKDQPIACGKCGSCRERLEAFEINNAIDPVRYSELP